MLDQGKVKELSGTDQPSSTRNYLLSKYRDDMGEQLLHALSLSRFYHPNAKSDILMVRNRVSLNSLRRLPSLKGIFTELQNQGIHYAGVQALICRGNVLGRSKRFDSTLTQAL